MDKLTVINKVITTLQKTYGDSAIQWACDMPDVSYLSSGIEEIDAVLHGGLPKGRVIEVFGLKQSGKTALACQLVSQCEQVLFVDAEHKMTKELANLLHLPSQTAIFRPESLEQCFEVIRDFINIGVGAIVVDSLPALPPLKETEEKNYDKVTGMSQTAGFLSRKIPVLLALLDKSQSILVIVNQQRANLNAMPFGEQYHTFGGLALSNYASVRLATARRSWLKHPKLDIFGMELAVLVDKTNTGVPRQGTSVPLVYGTGVIQNDQLVDVRTHLLERGKKALPAAKSDDYIAAEIEGEICQS